MRRLRWHGSGQNWMCGWWRPLRWWLQLQLVQQRQPLAAAARPPRPHVRRVWSTLLRGSPCPRLPRRCPACLATAAAAGRRRTWRQRARRHRHQQDQWRRRERRREQQQ
jgi:hypothetical protein